MDQDQSITQYIAGLKGGDEEAAAVIWEQFFHRVCGLARKKLGSAQQRMHDEEDIALSAMNALCQGAQEDRFRQLESRDDLWQILAMITSRKVANVWRTEKRSKQVGESVLTPKASEDHGGIDQIIAGDPSPEFLDNLSSTCEDLLSKLDDQLKEVALLKLQGHTNQEIADKQGRSVKSVERYMKMIRQKWEPS